MSDQHEQDGFVVWLTGLSGAGKSTLARSLAPELRARGVAVEILDGDEIRAALWPELGFTRADRDANVRRLASVAARIARHGVGVLVAAIAPYKDARAEAKESVEAQIGENRFVEVFATCTIDELARRDVKGLYKKALAGEIERFTGVSDPYEAPQNPAAIVDSSSQSVEEGVQIIVAALETHGLVPSITLPEVAR